MAETTITGLPNATTPLDGAERVPMDQDGTTVDATTQAIANLAGAAITAAVDAHEGAADPHPGYLLENDPSVTNARNPTAHKSTHATGGADALTPADIGAATAAQGNLADSAVQPDDLPGVVTTSAAGLQPATGHGSIAYAAQVTLNFSTLNGQINTISLTGALELLTSNLANGREVRLRLVCDGTERALAFPVDWKFVGTKPATIAASKVAILSLASFGASNADVIAAYAVQS
jgi:hypothetical protein